MGTFLLDGKMLTDKIDVRDIWANVFEVLLIFPLNPCAFPTVISFNSSVYDYPHVSVIHTESFFHFIKRERRKLQLYFNGPRAAEPLTFEKVVLVCSLLMRASGLLI